MTQDSKIIQSWQKNVRPWITAIQNDEIASRVLVTNQAIIDTVLAQQPRNVLDIGCGEGWLVRELGKSGIDALGIDVIPDFIDYARRQGHGRFVILPYEKISPSVFNEKFDVVVCNFSLLGEAPVNRLFMQIPQLLAKHGVLIVQTMHPLTACGDAKYEDGWRQGSWEGFSEQFCQPAPWYFRTLETWKALFSENHFLLREIREPATEESGLPTSIIFIADLVAKIS